MMLYVLVRALLHASRRSLLSALCPVPFNKHIYSAADKAGHRNDKTSALPLATNQSALLAQAARAVDARDAQLVAPSGLGGGAVMETEASGAHAQKKVSKIQEDSRSRE